MYNKKCVFFSPASNRVSDHQGALFAYPHVDMRFIKIAAMPVLNLYAKKWADQNNATFLPFGLTGVPTVTAGLVNMANNNYKKVAENDVNYMIKSMGDRTEPCFRPWVWGSGVVVSPPIL